LYLLYFLYLIFLNYLYFMRQKTKAVKLKSVNSRLKKTVTLEAQGKPYFFINPSLSQHILPRTDSGLKNTKKKSEELD